MLTSIANNRMKVSVSDLGAELTSIQSSGGLEYLWQPDPNYWKRQSPHLFPIVGTLPDNRYQFDGKEYELEVHGFVKDCRFQLLNQSPGKLNYLLTENERTLAQYPFRFNLEISYQLSENVLGIGYQVTNTDSKSMWFSLGAHPGFNCPLKPGETMDDYYLEFELREQVKRHLLENNLLTGEEEVFLNDENVIPLSAELFQRRAIVLKNLKSNWVTLKNRKNPHQIKVDFSGFPYLGIWSPPGPFVCIEPWYGVSSPKGAAVDLRKKEGMLHLEPGERFDCEYRVAIG